MGTGEDGVRAVYVVLSHREWTQVRRLADAILRSSPTARVLIAHDARREAFPADTGDDRIHIFPHGLPSDWGSWEMVEATLRAFALARELWNPQLVSLISGQDYPTRRLSRWEEEVLAAPSWIGEAKPLSYRPRWGRRRGEGDDRWTRYAYRWFPAPLANRGFTLPGSQIWMRMRERIARWLEPAVGVRYVARGRGRFYGIRRWDSPCSGERPIYLGAQWLAVRRPELDALLDGDLAAGSRLRKLYRRTIIPDESALVTPLSWRAAPSDLPAVTTYEWIAAVDGVRVWTIDDLDHVLRSGSPFCRKVDAVRSAELMDALDGIIA